MNIPSLFAASISASVVASVSKPSCYKLNGGILTADGYTWYELQNVNGHVSNYLLYKQFFAGYNFRG